jgi:hypothetical protein
MDIRLTGQAEFRCQIDLCPADNLAAVAIDYGP